MKRIVSLALALGLLLCLAPLAQAAERKAKIAISSGSVGGLYYRYGAAVAEIITQHAGLQASASMSAASIENLLQVQRRTDAHTGNFYYGTVLQDAAFQAFTGQCERFQGRPAKDVRVLWAMYPNLLHLVARPGADIKSVADLKGKNISTGAIDSGTEMQALMVLEAAGLKLSDLGSRQRMGYEASADWVFKGLLDAFFLSGGLPTPAVSGLANLLTSQGKQLELVDLPPESPLVRHLMDKYPGVIKPGVIGKTVYNTKNDNHTLAVWNIMVCHESVPEEQAYAVTKAVFEHLPQLQEKVKAAKDTSVAKTMGLADGPIPLHPGALRYFKETGLAK
jgi:TRAP transporter TAXI family solute receptor